MRPLRRALLSVHDKTGLTELARGLEARKIDILATGGTARLLRDAGLSIRSVSAETGAPEILGGRVKTLHPKLHGAILAVRDDPSHVADLQAQGIEPIDIVAVNLYPFEAVVERGTWLGEALENIDIGGPTMVRAAAKNFPFVVVLTDPDDYAPFLEELAKSDGVISPQTRERLAAKAFRMIARYDAAIAQYLTARSEEPLPESWALAGRRVQALRYGENPHQRAAFYASGNTGLAGARQLQGKELSYNNLLDLDAALGCVAEFEEPAVVVVKHSNPCGVALADSLAGAYAAARAADPVSAFGGVVAFNRELDAETARLIAETFVEATIAPGYSAEARELLASKKGLRLLLLERPALPTPLVRQVSGGFLVQEPDLAGWGPDEPRVVTRRAPTDDEWRALRFAWIVAKHVKSNAIVFANASATLGIGAGQMSRVDAAELAVRKARGSLAGSAVGSDAFFPFRDGLDVVAAAGASAVIQPGGSLRDAEVIAAADERDVAMVVTGMRHFRH